LNIQVATLVWACAISLIASEAVLTLGAAAQTAEQGIASAPSGGNPPAGGPLKTASVPAPSSLQDPAERSARSIECFQKADAQGLQGKTRKHFLRECKQGA
jgi:hypothetical protein